MRPEKVLSWREQLPPPFDRPGPVIKRRASVPCLTVARDGLEDGKPRIYPRRRNSAYGALDGTDRRVNWLRFMHSQHREILREKSSSAVEKLKRYNMLSQSSLAWTY